MIQCPRCSALWEPEAKYCGKCGEKLISRLDGGVTQKAVDLSDVRYKLGMVYYKKGVFSQAIAMWRKILEDDPDNLDVRSLVEEAERESLRSQE